MTARWGILLFLVLLWIHRGGWWMGGVYFEEDVAGHFYLIKSRLYLLAHGQEAWSWWDRLPLLGSPRLANVQASWLSPLNLFFVLLPPYFAWRLYPLWIDTLLVAASYWTARQWSASRGTAAWVALTWVVTGGTLFVSQHPPYKEAMLAALLAVGCALRYWRYRQRRYWLGLAACGFVHVASGNPSALYFNHLYLVALLPAMLLYARPSRAVLIYTALAYLGGCLLAWPALLPLFDYHAHSHRTLPFVAGTELSESLRMTFPEYVMRVASETQVGSPTPMKYGEGYNLPVDFSGALTLLALSALALRRWRWLLLLSLLVTLQSLGESGGLLWLLHKLAPFTLQVRGPFRFFFLSSWGLALAAGLAWQHWRGHSRWARWLSNGLAAWSVVFVLLAQSQRMVYYAPSVLTPPPMPPEWRTGRVSALRYSRPRPDLWWESAPVMQGIPTLLMPEVLFERGFLLGLAYSQWGPQVEEKLANLVRRARSVPVLQPQRPLLLSWGLTWLLAGQGDSFAWQRLQPDPPRHWFSQPAGESPRQWASREQGDPFATACLEATTPPGEASGGNVRVEVDRPDHQVLQVDGSGLLITADQWDPGWQCRHDGAPVETLRANLALKACWVKPGVRRVEWTYAPPWWNRALWHWAAGTALLAVGWFVSRRRG